MHCGHRAALLRGTPSQAPADIGCGLQRSKQQQHDPLLQDVTSHSLSSLKNQKRACSNQV